MTNSRSEAKETDTTIGLLEEIRRLRKTNAGKKKKQRKELERKGNETGAKPVVRVASNSTVSHDTSLINSESDVDYVPRGFEEELIDLCTDGIDVGEPQDLLDVKCAIDRFQTVNDIRGAGKCGGGGMEDFGLDEGDTEDIIEKDSQFSRLGLDNNGDRDDDDDDGENGKPTEKFNSHGLSKKKLKQLRRPTVSQLKQVCARPEVVEYWDTTAPDPKLLVFLKAHRNTVPVPPHWSHKRRYLQGKRGLEKSHFNLPDYIEATRISEIRKAIEDKDSKKTLKQRMREKVRPRHRKMNIDYQTLHDAFFKYATKPVLTKFGDVYFEGKETEMMFRRYTPGKLSPRCRDALGMTGVLDAPPWLVNMQRYGPPPSYPNLVVPGVNAHLPEGAALGFQPGGWGKPPGLEQLKIWGVTPRFEEVVLGEDQLEGLEGGNGGYWGALQTVDSEDDGGAFDEESDEGQPDGAATTEGDTSNVMTISGQATPVAFDPSGISSIASFTAGFTTPGVRGGITGIESVSSALDTPQSVDLRRSGFASDSSSKPYTVLERVKAPAQGGSLFTSSTIYNIPNASDAVQ